MLYTFRDYYALRVSLAKLASQMEEHSDASTSDTPTGKFLDAYISLR